MKNGPFYLFIFGLIFAPLAFGTVEQWSLVILELTMAAAYVVFFVKAWFCKDEILKIPGLMPLMLLLGLMVLQMVPLPSSLVQLISPGTYEVYAPVLSLADNGDWISFSINRRETLHEMLRICSYGLMYILTVQLLSDPQKLKKTVNVVILLAAGIAFMAIVQAVGSPDKIYWLREVPDNASPFGPWINPNQFAGYIELMCPLAFGLFLFYKPRVRGDESLREKFVSFFTVPGIHWHLFLGFGTVLMVLSVFVSLCRGGMLSIIVAGVVFLFLVKWKFPGRGKITVLVIISCLFLAISWFGWGIIISEFNQGVDSAGNINDGRLAQWTDVSEIIKDFPVVGAGFGSFLFIYPLYKTINDNYIYEHVHNDYLELFTDGGVIGFILAAWFVLAVLFHGLKMIRVRRDRYAVLVGIGSISGIVALLAHSVTDFNMHNGAVGLYFFFLCGLVVASVNIRFGHYSSTSLLKPQSRYKSIFLTTFGVCLLFVTTVTQGGAFLAWSNFIGVADIYVNKQLSEKYLQKITDNMSRAVFWNPLEGAYSYKLGTVKWYSGEKDEAIQEHILAVKKNPMEGVFLQQLGLLVEEESGKQLIEVGYERALNKDKLVLNYAEWLLWKGRRVEAMTVLKNRLLQDHKEIFNWMPLLNSHSFTRQEFAEILPVTVDAWIEYGRYCEINDKLSDADFFFGNGAELLSGAFDPDPNWFSTIIRFYQRQGEDAKSLAVLRQAVERIPDSSFFHVLLGDYYQSQGIIYRAKEEFERALILEPANARARSKLRKLGFADSY